MAKSILLKFLIVILITQFKVATLPKALEEKIISFLHAGEAEKNKYPIILHIFEKNDVIKDYEFVRMEPIENDIFTYILKKGMIEYYFQIIFESKDNNNLCDIEEINFHINSQIKVSYINNVIAYDKKKKQKLYNNEYIYCTSLSEIANNDISNTEIFSTGSNSSKIINSAKLFILIGKVIISIAELNFKANILHGDIDIDSIKIKHKEGSITYCEDYEPIITNFHKMVQNPRKTKLEQQEVKYEKGYRTPQMEKCVIKLNDDQVLYNYQYSDNFYEDVYALGVTIDKIIEAQSSKINIKEDSIVGLQEISKKMIEGKTSTEKRLKNNNIEQYNMKEILDMYYIILIKLKTKDVLNMYKIFEDRVKTAFSSLKTINRII